MFSARRILTYLDLVRERGLPARRLLAGTGIQSQSLSDPDFLIDIEQHDAVVANLLRLTRESDIGFAAGERFDPSAMGIVGYALLSSRTLRNAMAVWQQYSNSPIGSPLRLLIDETRSGHWSITVLPYAARSDLQRFYVEEFLAGGRTLVTMLAAERPVFSRLAFAYPRPPHAARYRRLFDCPVEFGAERTVLSVRSPQLDLPIASGNEQLNSAVSQYCSNILRGLPRSGGVEPRLRGLFLGSSSQLPRQIEAARHLGFSHRTLHRRLSGNGRSYRTLKDEFRLDLAREYLDSGHMSQKEIAHALGFSSPSVFCRAFKAWTGESPGEYRLRSRREPDR